MRIQYIIFKDPLAFVHTWVKREKHMGSQNQADDDNAN